MYREKKFGALSSSVNPNELAKTVEGIIKAVGGGIVFFGFSSIAGDINSLAEQAGQLITLGYAFFGVCETVFGIIRKIAVSITERGA